MNRANNDPSAGSEIVKYADDRSPSDDDEIGYRKPPKQHRFQPGQSGNPRGRPKGARSLRILLALEMNEKVSITDNGRPRRISKLQAIIKAQTHKAAKGNVAAAVWLVGLHIQAEGIQDDRPIGDKLSPADQAILDRFLGVANETVEAGDSE